MDWKFEELAGPYGGTSEGPAWDGECLLFSHIPGSRIMRYDPKSGKCSEYRTETGHTNGLAFDLQGRLYGCERTSHCITRFEPDGRMTRLPNRLDGKRLNYPNDLVLDHKGRIWYTDQFSRIPESERELHFGAVIRLDPQPDGSWNVNRMTFDTTSPNGILFSKDERVLYVAQSDYDGIRELRAYPLKDDDTLGPYTVLYTFGNDHRGPHRGVDGMVLDTEGNIIATAGGPEAGPGSMMYVISPTGRVLESHPVPLTGNRPKVTNCTFGDKDLSTLYVTTGNGHLLRVRNTGRRGYLLYPN
jgi:gluconolactonase